MSNYLVELININKTFKKGPAVINVLNDFNLAIKRGEFISIVGPSGVGKSTLLHIIGGLERPDSGIVNFEGRGVYKQKNADLDSYRNNEVGFVFQFHYLLNDFTAIENVMMPAMIGKSPKNEAAKRAAEILEKVGMSDRQSHYPMELSGGEQQRVAVARALMNNPKLLLADEPTGNLDKKNSYGVFELFKKLNEEGVTVVIVTHDEHLSGLSDKEIKLEKV
ncbi:ABC transporter ATP-binding protein [Flexistipes sinusarabici]|uniref:ABC transporter ATP-binding protein n=1 Tax=Flexistipes sinusarabici TaxID=2352 RepID=UPI002353B8F2|nr:ABC transporter ATP-binding protein [Flexistipes sinusarabici]